MKRILTALTLLSLSLSLLAGCGTDKQTGGVPEKLVLTYVTSPLNVPTIVEREQGIFARAFEELGTAVEYAEITAGSQQTQALASGDVQILYGVGGTSVILSAANGADIKILNLYSRSPKAYALYSRDSALTTPESLRGKTIAGPVGTNLHELLAAFLESGGMTLTDVNYVSMAIPEAKAALDGGSVDAALMAGATAYQAKAQGYHLVTDGAGLIEAIVAVATTEKYYRENPQIMETFGAAQTQLAEYLQQEPEIARQTVAQSLELTPEAVAEMLPYYDFSTKSTETDIAGLQATADFMLAAEMIPQAVDVSALFLD